MLRICARRGLASATGFFPERWTPTRASALPGLRDHPVQLISAAYFQTQSVVRLVHARVVGAQFGAKAVVGSKLAECQFMNPAQFPAGWIFHDLVLGIWIGHLLFCHVWIGHALLRSFSLASSVPHSGSRAEEVAYATASLQTSRCALAAGQTRLPDHTPGIKSCTHLYWKFVRTYSGRIQPNRDLAVIEE